MARDKIGSFSEASDCEYFLHNWLQQYVTSDSEASPEVKARYPLREASVRVRENPEKPGRLFVHRPFVAAFRIG